MADPLRKKMTLPDGEVSYLEWEADGPPLHFAHATGFNAETYRALLTPLQGRFRITAADMRGHGFSTLTAVPGMQTGWTIYGEDLAKVVAELSPDAPVIRGLEVSPPPPPPPPPLPLARLAPSRRWSVSWMLALRPSM